MAVTEAQLKAEFVTGAVITEPMMDDLISAIFAEDTAVQSAGTGGNSVSGSQVGGLLVLNGSGVAASAGSIPSAGLSLATASDFPALANVSSPIFVPGVVMDAGQYVSSIVIQVSSSGILALPVSNASEPLPSGAEIGFQVVVPASAS